MSVEENKALVRRFYEEIDKGNLEAMDELVDEGYINHHPPPFPGLARAGRVSSKPSSFSGRPRPAVTRSKISLPKGTRSSPG